MNKKEAIKDSIEHWKRMRDCVIEIEMKPEIDWWEYLDNRIAELPSSMRCALCQKYYESSHCTRCPLYEIDDCCFMDISSYHEAVDSDTPEDFVKNAEIMIKQLEICLEREK